MIRAVSDLRLQDTMNPDFGTFCVPALRLARPWRGAVRARPLWPLLFLLLALCLLGAQTVQAQTEALLPRMPVVIDLVEFVKDP